MYLLFYACLIIRLRVLVASFLTFLNLVVLRAFLHSLTVRSLRLQWHRGAKLKSTCWMTANRAETSTKAPELMRCRTTTTANSTRATTSLLRLLATTTVRPSMVRRTSASPNRRSEMPVCLSTCANSKLVRSPVSELVAFESLQWQQWRQRWQRLPRRHSWRSQRRRLRAHAN